jgi:hypothetical protein
VSTFCVQNLDVDSLTAGNLDVDKTNVAPNFNLEFARIITLAPAGQLIEFFSRRSLLVGRHSLNKEEEDGDGAESSVSSQVRGRFDEPGSNP